MIAMTNSTERPELAPGDLDAIALGARVYRVRSGFVDGSLEMQAFEGATKVAGSTVQLPGFFQPASASITARGDDIVVAVTAFHCKDDRELQGTWVVDGSCATRSTSW